MNKKIDIYTLLGLIKDGKAPKRIHAYVCNWVYDNNKDYINDFEAKLFEDCLENVISTSLNDEIEILDEEDEFIDIESFGIHYSWDYIDYKNIEELKKYVNKDFQNIFNTLDNLIKNQKKIIQALKENE